MVGKPREDNKCDSLFLQSLAVTELDILVDRRVNISLAVGMRLKTLLILPLLVASLQAASVADLTFNLNGDYTEYSVINCLETASGSLDIPSTYSGLPVTSIGSGTFSGCSSLSSITIGDSVTSIGSQAFYNCNALSITLNNAGLNLNSAGYDLYNRVTNITIPEGTTEIADYAFYGCSNVTSITIPDSVTSIGDEAFYYCTDLSSITIPDSVTSIGGSAF